MAAPMSSTAEALTNIAQRIAQIKADDPLATVTVVAPSVASGRDASAFIARHLGAGCLNIDVTSLNALVDEYFVRTSKRSETTTILTEQRRLIAVKQVLDSTDNAFARFKEAPSTAQALAGESAILDHFSPEQIQAALDTDTAGDSQFPPAAIATMQIHADASARLHANFSTHVERTQWAIDHIEDCAHRCGHLLVLAGIPAQYQIDRRFFELLCQQAEAVFAPPQDQPNPSVHTFVDEGAEVRFVVARIRQLLAEDPHTRIGAFWPTNTPYAELFHRYMGEAGLTYAGPGPFTLENAPIVRALLDLIRLDPDLPDKRVLLAIKAQNMLAKLSVLEPGTGDTLSISSRQLENYYRGYSQDAVGENVVTELNITDAAFPAEFVGRIRKFLASDASKNLPRSVRWQLETTFGQVEEPDPDDYQIGELVAFALDNLVDTLKSCLTDLNAAQTWSGASDALLRVIRQVLSDRSFDGTDPISGVASTWLFKEKRALSQAVEDMRQLDSGPGPSGPEEVAETLLAWVEGMRLPVASGRKGFRVSAGTFPQGIGRDLDQVFCLGLVESQAPQLVRQDPILTVPVLTKLAGSLENLPVPLPSELVEEQHHHLRGLLATAPHVALSVPLGDTRSKGDRMPSRWLESLYSGDLPPALSWSAVSAFGEGDVEPLTEQWWAVRALQFNPDATLPAGDPMRRNQKIALGRINGIFDEFNGNLFQYFNDHPEMNPLTRAIAPSSLEMYVASPLEFFVDKILRARMIESAALNTELSASERGTLIHAILERLVLERLIRGSELDAAVVPDLRELTASVLERIKTPQHWSKTLWEQAKTDIAQRLDRWWQDSQSKKDIESAAAVFPELAFGISDDPNVLSVEMDLSNGTVLQLKGFPDRITISDSEVSVTDYKTGKPGYYDGITSNDPTACGTKFQLGVYCLAGQALAKQMGVTPERFSGNYSFIRPLGEKIPDDKRVSFSGVAGSDDEAWDQFVLAINAVAEGISAGQFPPKVSKPNRYRGYQVLSNVMGEENENYRRWQRMLFRAENRELAWLGVSK